METLEGLEEIHEALEKEGFTWEVRGASRKENRPSSRPVLDPGRSNSCPVFRAGNSVDQRWIYRIHTPIPKPRWSRRIRRVRWRTGQSDF